MSKLIVSYRPDDTGNISGRLEDFLVNRFGDNTVQLGLEGFIQPGDDFVEAIESAVKQTDTTLVILIGNKWSEGEWLNDANDYNHVAIKTALEEKVRIMPVLINGATMPSADQLPEAFASLARRVGLTISEDNFRDEAGKLADQLEKHVKKPAPKPTTRTLSQQTNPPKPRPQPTPKPSVFTQAPAPRPSTQQSPSMAFSNYGNTSYSQEEEPAVAMPGFVTSIMRGLINSLSDYIALMAVIGAIFAVGNVLELEYFRQVDSLDSDTVMLIYAVVLGGIFGVGIYVLMHGLSIATPRVTTGMAFGVVIAYGASLLIISQIDVEDVFFANSVLTSTLIQSGESFGRPDFVNNIWIVRAVQAGIIAAIVSELFGGAYSQGVTRLNIGLAIILFIGLIGISFGYSELMERLLEMDLDTATEARLVVAAGGAVRGAGLALLFLITFKAAYNARPPAITSTA